MGFPEIVIIAAAGFFLLWLWRGGGQPKPAVAPAACAAPSCGQPRAVGCLGVLFVLFIASGLLFIGFRGGRTTGIGLALLAGMALLLFARRRWRGVAIVGMFAIVGMTLFAVSLLSIRSVRQAARQLEQEDLHWVDDWLDGPAANFSPFHRARLERAHAEAQRQQARAHAEISRWHALARQHGHDGQVPPVLVDSARGRFDFNDLTAGGATLSIDLKPNALSQGNVSPDALAATLLAIVDLITASDQEGDASPLTLSMLHRMDVQPRAGSAIPLNQIAHIRKESREGKAQRITRIAVNLNKKSKRPESEQIRQAGEFLEGIERNRQSQRGFGDFQVRHTDSSLLIVIDRMPAVGIPVEAALAAAIPEPPAAPLSPAAPQAVVPPAAPASAAPPAAPVPPAVTAPRPKHKTPEEGSDLAHQLLMWTLPQSFGGAAESKFVSQDLTPVVATAPPAPTVAEVKPPAAVEIAAVTPAPVAPTAPASAAAVRPAWLDGKAEYLDDQGVFHMRRSTGRLYQSADESHEAAAELLLEMTRDYATSLLGREAAGRVSIPIHTILHDFVDATWDEQGPPPGLPDDDAWETHVLLKFDAADRQLVEQTWRHSVVDKNLRYAGAGASLLLALMGTVFGYLKVDTATRGYYSGRLKLATGAVVAAITTLGILLAAGTLRL